MVESSTVTAVLPDVPELIATGRERLSGQVLPDYIDTNGHMNIVRYFELNSLALMRFMEEDAGLDPDHRAKARTSMFTAEHHLMYYSELLVGEPFSVYPVVVERSNRALHMMSYLVDTTRGVVANTLETLGVHVSLDSRRAVPFPPATAGKLDDMAREQLLWNWRPIGCGSIGLRTRA
jgi:acyl-CoA thioester hydrolase